MDWNSVTAQLLMQRVAGAINERWGCFYAGVHLTFNGWFERKLSAQVLVGLQTMRSRHLELELPTQGQLALQLLEPCAGYTERHLALGRLHYTVQTQTPPGAWVLAKGTISYGRPIANHMYVYIIMCVIKILFFLL